jgi:hypothetical protein
MLINAVLPWQSFYNILMTIFEARLSEKEQMSGAGIHLRREKWARLKNYL